eukprot:410802_1
MKTIMCTAIGPTKQVLKLLHDAPVPRLAVDKPTRVLVKVLYASVNPIDYKMVTGMMGMISPKKPPFIFGRDFSGRVVAKGNDPKLKDLSIGDLVYGQCWNSNQGSFAEYCLCDVKNIAKMPHNMAPLDAASIPLVTQTSYQAALKMKLKSGDKLLILGGSTATGLMAIQIAKNIGCSEVIVTSSREEYCKSFGADRVINYKKENWIEVLKDYQVDAIYDCVGGRQSWDECRTQNILKQDGYFVTIVGDTAHGDQYSVKRLIGTGLSVMNRKFWGSAGYQTYELHLADSSKNLGDITALIESKKLRAVLDPESPFKFEEYQQMIDKCMSHKARGKLVIHVSDNGVDEKDIISLHSEETQSAQVNKKEEQPLEHTAKAKTLENEVTAQQQICTDQMSDIAAKFAALSTKNNNDETEAIEKEKDDKDKDAAN